MLWGAEKLVPAEYWCPYGTLLDLYLSHGWLHKEVLKTNIASLLYVLESQPNEKPVVGVPQGGIYIIDGMATIQQLNINTMHGKRTFLNLAHILLQHLANRANSQLLRRNSLCYWHIQRCQKSCKWISGYEDYGTSSPSAMEEISFKW